MRKYRKTLVLLLLIAINFIGCKGMHDSNVITTKPENTNQIPGTSQVVNLVAKEDQVRNNKLIIDTESIHKFWGDPVFMNFKDTGKSPADYEKSLIEEAEDKGINSAKLLAALKTAKSLKADYITMYPVIIDTAKYNDKDSFIFIFTWEITKLAKESKTVKPLGHTFIVAIEADSKKVIAQVSCK